MFHTPHTYHGSELAHSGIICQRSCVRINNGQRHGRQRGAQLSRVPHADEPQVQRVRSVRLLLHGLRAARGQGVLCAHRMRGAHEGNARAREPGRIGDPLRDAPAHTDRREQPAKQQDWGQPVVPTHVGDPLPRSQALHAPPARRFAINTLREDGVRHVGRAHGCVRQPRRRFPAPQLPCGRTGPGGGAGPRQCVQACACAARGRLPQAGALRRGHHGARSLADHPL